jgi:hypothetical protein
VRLPYGDPDRTGSGHDTDTRLNDAADLPVDDTFRACTIESLAAYEHHAIDLRAARFTLHLGATNENPVRGMFSFTPALPVGADGPRFARPAYNDRRFVNPKSKQSPSGAKDRRSTDQVRERGRQPCWAAGRPASTSPSTSTSPRVAVRGLPRFGRAIGVGEDETV